MRTEHDLVAALTTLESQAPDADEVLAVVRRRADKGRRAPEGQRGRLVPRWGRAQVLAPLGAAAAVTAIAVAAALAAPGAHLGRNATSSGILSGNGSAPVAALGTITATNGLARFFLALPRQGININRITYFPLSVYSAVTGRLAGSLTTPRWFFTKGQSVAASTASDLTFIVANSTGPARLSACHSTTTLYRLDLSEQGVPSSLTRLALPVIPGDVTALAATPDGRMVAYVTSACELPFGEVAVLGVVNTATGQRKQWTWPAPGVEVPSLSISADGRLIEYLSNPNKVLSPVEGQTLDTVNNVGLLPTSSPDGSVLRYGQTVLHWSAQPFGSSAVTADGKDLYYCAPNPVALRVYHVATGVTSRLATYPSANFCELEMSRGSLLLALGADGAGVTRAVRYDVTSGQSSPIPLHDAWMTLAASR
jgi:hypothetical protein